MVQDTLPKRGRRSVAMAVVGATILLLAGGLIKLQILDHAELAEQSENNQIRIVPIIPRRGVVYDRDGQVIIDNRPSYTVSIVPAEQAEAVTVPNLSALIGMDTLEVFKRIKRNMVGWYQPAQIKKDIPFEVVAVLEEQSAEFPGVTYHMERVRQYTDSLGAETFTGYVGEVSPEEIEAFPQAGYTPGRMIGKKGFERQYDRLLRGSEGTEYVEVSASGQILGPYQARERTEAVPGSDVWLTIDNDLQRTCVRVLDSFCCGAVVAMDPNNGEVLAAASYPGYDPNIFSSVIPESLWLEISTDTTHPLLNRVLNGLYPPGSTTKLVTVGAAIEEGLINQNTVLKPCRGGMQYGNRFFRCWEHGGHGSVNCIEALEVSCDVFMYQLGDKMGVDVLADYLRQCGFGSPTGADLPGEFAGLNPTSGYYDERYGRNRWTRALVLNNAIGQGEILVTPLQLTQFFCGVVNDGVVYRPHLLKRIRRPSGDEIAIAPEVSFHLPFTPRTLELLNDGIRMVVEGEGGTARSIRREDYRIGGKTGTAQNPHGDNHSWFCGVAPVGDEEIVVCAIVENAGDGSRVAAPVVAAVMDTYMAEKAADTKLADAGGVGDDGSEL